jgi:hypothetical protein
MIDQMFDTFRKTSESSLQMQQEMFTQWAQQWPTVPMNAAGVSADWLRTLQKRWIEFSTESLERNRVGLDSMYRSGIQFIEQTLRLSDAKSPDDCRHALEDLWRKLIDVFKEQSESQLHDFQKGVEKCVESFPKAAKA